MKRTLYRNLLVGLLALLACKKEEEAPTPDTCNLTQEQRQVIADINQYAIPFTTADPEIPPTDLAPLDADISNAKIIGMGEATHGTKEFFQMKDRLFRYMVTQHGYKAIAFETSWGDGININRYITQGIGGSAREVLREINYGIWKAEEVAALIEWMRAYNTGKAYEEQIYFYGFDLNEYKTSFALLEEYIGQVDPTWLPAMTELYKPFKDVGLDNYWNQAEPFKADVRQRLQQVYDYIASQQAAYTTASSNRAYQEALQTVRVLKQVEELFKDADTYRTINVRDKYMAENALWIQNHLGANSKIALWAHNTHVGRINSDNVQRQGWHIKNALGEAYQILAFAFAAGSFNAVEQKVEANNQVTYGEWKAFTVGEPICASITALLHRATPDNFFLNTKAVPANIPLHSWLFAEKPVLEVDADFSEQYPESDYAIKKLGEVYDVLIYFDTTTESTMFAK